MRTRTPRKLPKTDFHYDFMEFSGMENNCVNCGFISADET